MMPRIFAEKKSTEVIYITGCSYKLHPADSLLLGVVCNYTFYMFLETLLLGVVCNYPFYMFLVSYCGSTLREK